jgi:tetratricopeptide (TPR) repeat protein
MMGNYKTAIPLYQKLIKQNPENDEFKYQLGKCLLKTFTMRLVRLKVFMRLQEKMVWLVLLINTEKY